MGKTATKSHQIYHNDTKPKKPQITTNRDTLLQRNTKQLQRDTKLPQKVAKQSQRDTKQLQRDTHKYPKGGKTATRRHKKPQITPNHPKRETK